MSDEELGKVWRETIRQHTINVWLAFVAGALCSLALTVCSGILRGLWESRP